MSKAARQPTRRIAVTLNADVLDTLHALAREAGVRPAGMGTMLLTDAVRSAVRPHLVPESALTTTD